MARNRLPIVPLVGHPSLNHFLNRLLSLALQMALLASCVLLVLGTKTTVVAFAMSGLHWNVLHQTTDVDPAGSSRASEETKRLVGHHPFAWLCRPFGPFACPPGAPSSHGNVSMA
eukprot:scaffold73_cov337-Pavlova_lutheri.AAC.43